VAQHNPRNPGRVESLDQIAESRQLRGQLDEYRGQQLAGKRDARQLRDVWPGLAGLADRLRPPVRALARTARDDKPAGGGLKDLFELSEYRVRDAGIIPAKARLAEPARVVAAA
jgi:hypothetical protein